MSKKVKRLTKALARCALALGEVAEEALRFERERDTAVAVLESEREDAGRDRRLLDEAADRIDALERDVNEWADTYAKACDSLNAVAAERDDFHTKWAAAEQKLTELGLTEEMPVIHEPITKSAVEVPRGDKPDAGEGRVIAFMPMSELEPGMKFRLDNGQVFEEATYVEHDRVDESAFVYDDRATIKVTVAWGGSGHFRPEHIVQVDVTPLSH